MSSSVTRAAWILELLARSDRPLSLTRVAATLDIPKSTAHSILRDLVAECLVTVSDTSTYTVGLKAFEIGSAHIRGSSAASLVAPELARLTRNLGVTSHYAILDGTDAVYLCKEDPPGLGIQLASSIGARLPSHMTAVGKSCLAWLDKDEVPRHVALNVRDVNGRRGTLNQLRKEIAVIKERGYACDDAHAAAGIQCVAAPIFDVTGLKGAIGVSYLQGSMTSLDEVAEQVCSAAHRVSTALGGIQSS